MIGRNSAALLAGLVLASSSAPVRADGVGMRDTSGVIDDRDGTVSSGSVSDAGPHRDSIVVVPQAMSADVETRRQPAINIYVDPSSAAGVGRDASEGQDPDDRRPRRHRRRDR